MEKSIPITLNLDNLPSYDSTSNLNSICINYEGIKYLITLSHDLPIKTLTIKDTVTSQFTSCFWNELVFSPNYEATKNQFVFKQFVKKQIDSSGHFYMNETDELKYIGNTFININMLPENPRNMYYMMKSDDTVIRPGDSGKPIFNQANKLVGIISKTKDDIIYVIPIIYIIKSLSRIDNKNIYTLKLKNIQKIKTSHIKNNMVYHNSLKSYIPVDVYLNLEGDIGKIINVTTKSSITKNCKFTTFNSVIKNSNALEIKDNNIKITSGLLHYLKLVDNIEMVVEIFKNMGKKKRLSWSIDDVEFYLSF